MAQLYTKIFLIDFDFVCVVIIILVPDQKIVPHLWYDKEAKEAAEFYASVFPDSKVVSVSEIKNTPSGDCDIVSFEIMGLRFMSISAGPYFSPNPSISFMINFDSSQMKSAKEKLDEVWKKLLDGGNAIMPLDAYPFSARYGWVQDKYGFSWQLILTNPEGEDRPVVLPALMFANEKYGKAEEAREFYTNVFKDGPDSKRETKPGAIVHYGKDQAPNKEGTVMFSDFELEGTWFFAMDAAGTHKFDFNEAVSFMVNCDSQKEIDYYWRRLSHVPDAEQCGWLKDKFGVSWQIVPTVLDKLMSKGTDEQREKVTQAFLKMKKFDIAKLEEAYGKV